MVLGGCDCEARARERCLWATIARLVLVVLLCATFMGDFEAFRRSLVALGSVRWASRAWICEEFGAVARIRTRPYAPRRDTPNDVPLKTE